MKFLTACTTAELAAMVSINGYPGVAKGIAEAGLGERSAKEWEAIMEVTAHQLILKQIWDEEKDERDGNPFTSELQEFIKNYVESKWMVRCTNIPEKSVLMIHHMNDDTWLSHIIYKDFLHEFSYIKSEEILDFIKEFYSFQPVSPGIEAEFRLTDDLFDMLSEKKKLKKVIKLSSFSYEEEKSFNNFIEDLDQQQWSLYNISYFNIPHYEKEPFLENIVFFLPGPNGIWLVEYTDHETQPVHIRLASSEDWNDLLAGVGTVASYAN
ncbi:hypothetical protein [Peribacillus glennii]|uniref:Uncharacterized protein n=1 Tax=Peribacillus glennii TaxID=2303991 RepID=A0A372LHF1_9BACI|nr:hypothetical protein [Peribacillus glennii]RFU65382.1 hypothetical protein D0466_05680 [Peribacillus glennii]